MRTNEMKWIYLFAWIWMIQVVKINKRHQHITVTFYERDISDNDLYRLRDFPFMGHYAPGDYNMAYKYWNIILCNLFLKNYYRIIPWLHTEKIPAKKVVGNLIIKVLFINILLCQQNIQHHEQKTLLTLKRAYT